MKYCQYCGTQLVDDAKFCSHCGKETSQPSQKTTTNTESVNHPNIQKELVNKLSSRLKTNGIIWLVVAILQIIIGLVGAWFTLIVGVLNIISAVNNIKNSKRMLSNQNGIVKTYEPITNPIIVLVYNILIGGVFGVLGSIYYLICVRGFVMENKDQFLAMETNEPFDNNVSKPSEKEMHIEIILTEQEALNGVQKDITVVGLKQPLKVNFPKNIKDGNTLALHNVNITTEDGKTIKKDLYIKVCIQK